MRDGLGDIMTSVMFFGLGWRDAGEVALKRRRHIRSWLERMRGR